MPEYSHASVEVRNDTVVPIEFGIEIWFGGNVIVFQFDGGSANAKLEEDERPKEGAVEIRVHTAPQSG